MEMTQFERATGLLPALAARWYAPLTQAMVEFAIDTPTRKAAFLAHVGHESSGFRHLVESFNYRPEALAIFSRVPAEMRAKLGRQLGEVEVPVERQAQIANLAYGGRFGNGNPASGDGWRYRGRGLKQITFADNYRECGKALGIDLLARPELLATSNELAAHSAGWFWATRGCNELADGGDFEGTTRVINGPAMSGLAQHIKRWEVARRVLIV